MPERHRRVLGLVLSAGLMAGPLTLPALAQPAPEPTEVNVNSPEAKPAGPVAIVNGKQVPVPNIAMGDAATVKRIIEEGRDRSQVMDHLTHLTQQIGPRLTGSTRAKQANDWARQRFESWGLSGARLEQWGTVGVGFDRGPSTGKVLVRVERGPQDDRRVEFDAVRQLTLTTLSWTPGTEGPVRGPVVKMPKTEEEYAAVKESLKGAWLLLEPPPPVGQRGVRSRAAVNYQQRTEARQKVAAGEDPSTLPIPQRVIFDGIAGFIATSRDERVWTGAVGGWRDLTMDTLHKDVQATVTLSDYDFINSRLADREPIQLELDLKHTFNPGPVPVFNTIAEIRGSEKPDEYVVIGAHMDSWDGPGSQGATDNGTGTSVMLEAARILAAALKDAPPEARPKRTIQVVLYTGEEQGLLGSSAHLEMNKDKWPAISAAFVDDGGTNSQGGTPAPTDIVPFLAAASAPVNYQFFSKTDNRWLNVNIRDIGNRLVQGGGSDHAAYNRRGIPGFYWDEVGRADYQFGWHTQHDTIALAIPEYLMQSAVNTAVVAYNLACADGLLPRPPAPQPTEGQNENQNSNQPAQPRGQTAPAGQGAGSN
ncbi:MAG: hypothetical protein C0475_05725 [Planctomyces sp.]|nr:hypothetical protein [Planctomyces sp.]MBA4039646.1 hypothetical protein [Planctomyces sp.]MBA4119946.1 hypothetical protein [Isosphaera sp.]